MNRWLGIGLSAAAVVAVLALAAPILMPADIYKGEIVREVARATGRKLTISGPLRISLLPWPALCAEGVSLANMAGGHEPAMIAADRVRLGLHLWPLLMGRPDVSSIRLERPVIHLEVDGTGRANWTFERERKSPQLEAGRAPRHWPVQRLSISDGRVIYANERRREFRSFEKLDVSIDIPGLDAPASVSGAFGQPGRRAVFRANVATPRSVVEDKQAALAVSLRSQLFKAAFGGRMMPDGALRGAITFDSPSLRETAGWLNVSLPNSQGLRKLSLQADLTHSGKTSSLKQLHAVLDGMEMRGNIVIVAGPRRPFLQGALSIDRLDLNPYLVRPRRSDGTTGQKPAGWSRQAITLDALDALDASLALDAGALALGKARLGKSRIALEISNGHLTAKLHPVSLYGGSGNLRLEAHAGSSVPRFHADLRLENIALRPFLTDTLGVTHIAGNGAIEMNLSSQGASTDAIMHGLDGKGSIRFRDGQILGVDLGAVARAISRMASVDTAAFTQYRTMTGSFAVARGKLNSTDFHLAAPHLEMSGAGDIDIGDRAIDFRLVPQASAVIAHRKIEIGLPFRVKGPWRHVHYAPDSAGLFRGVIENLEGGRAPFKGLFGTEPKPSGGKKKKHKSLEDALKNMFGIH